MSSKRNFRVSVILSDFFCGENRETRRARIWIDDDIKKISDLARRIEETFQIKNFQLVGSQDHYLPPSEDVEILDDKELIWVFQDGDQSDKSASTLGIGTKKTRTKRLISPTRESQEVSQKKKKRRARDTSEQADTELPGTSSSTQSKQKESTSNLGAEKFDESRPFIGTDKELRRLVKDLEEYMIYYLDYVDIITRGELWESIRKPEDQPLQEEMSRTTDTTLSSGVEAGEPVRDRATAQIETVERTATKASKAVTHGTETPEATFSETMDVPRDISIEHNTSLISETGIGSFPSLGNESTEFEDDASDLNKPIDEAIKLSDNSMLNFNRDDESLSSKMSTISNRARASGVEHLGGNSSLGSLDLVSSDCSETTKTSRETHSRGRKKKGSGRADTSTCSEECRFGTLFIYNGKARLISEEDILEAPLMEDSRPPKEGDVIGFKVLLITENCTPELSSRIIGRVLQYSEESKEVLFTILNGLDQCNAAKLIKPRGYKKSKSKAKRCVIAWKDVLEARLLCL